MDLLANLAPFCDDVSMTSLVGSRSDDVIGEVAGCDWSTGMVKWHPRLAGGRVQGLTCRHGGSDVG